MRNRGEWRAVMAMLPAIAGVSLSSGRELALFFGQLKQASWLGVFAASACFGGLLGLLLWRGPAVAAGSEALARLCAALRLLVAALTAAFMLSRLGAMGALTLPLRHGYAFGAAFGGCLALALWGIRKKWIAGAVLFAALVCFYAACAADPRPVSVYRSAPVEFALAGSAPAALGFAFCYASMNVCAASWSLKQNASWALRPVWTGLKASVVLLIPLCLANLALMRGGDPVLPLPMPWVPLCARWGLFGFWLCAAIEFLCAAATLSAVAGFLAVRWRSSRRERLLTALMLTGALIVFGALSHGRA